MPIAGYPPTNAVPQSFAPPGMSASRSAAPLYHCEFELPVVAVVLTTVSMVRSPLRNDPTFKYVVPENEIHAKLLVQFVI